MTCRARKRHTERERVCEAVLTCEWHCIVQKDSHELVERPIKLAPLQLQFLFTFLKSNHESLTRPARDEYILR